MTEASTLSRLPDLIVLAEEESSEKRRTLLRELTDHFFGGAPRTAAEDALYDGWRTMTPPSPAPSWPPRPC